MESFQGISHQDAFDNSAAEFIERRLTLDEQRALEKELLESKFQFSWGDKDYSQNGAEIENRGTVVRRGHETWRGRAIAEIRRPDDVYLDGTQFVKDNGNILFAIMKNHKVSDIDYVKVFRMEGIVEAVEVLVKPDTHLGDMKLIYSRNGTDEPELFKVFELEHQERELKEAEAERHPET